MCDFCHLHLHTEYSLLDGLNRVDKLMEKVKNSGMNSVAISDHGVLYGVPEFFFMAKDFGIKPIIGCELYLAPDKRDIRKDIDGVKYYHLLALAKNATGYQNLLKLVSLGFTEGMYYKPRVDRELLKKYSEGLIITSACLAGPLSRHIIMNQESKALDWLNFFKDTFKDDFYLELQRNGFNTDDLSQINIKNLPFEHQEAITLQTKVNTKLREYSEAHKIELVATTDAHYLDKDDRDTQEILFAIKDGKLMSDKARRLGYLDTYVKTPDEIETSFKDLPEVLENSMKISEKIEDFNITFNRVQPRYYNIPKGSTSQDVLREQVEEGVKLKYKNITPELLERIEYELEVIHSKGYDDYFLVVSDIMKWAKSQGIVVGVRGSAAGSVVAYCLDIINVEPISWELYFERFLNPERPSAPDIDMDIQDDRREELIQYVEKNYGKENVVAICAIGRMKTKAAIRDVARVMGIDLSIADKLSKKVHVIFGKVKKIEQMMEDDSEFADMVNANPDLIRLKSNVSKIEGMARHVSTHACGYLITPDPIVNYVSVQLETRGGEKIITQNEGAWIEALGLMKFDFLGLRNLTIIKNTLEFIKKYKNKDVIIEKIPNNDKKTFELFSRGETIGVFQFEGAAMQKYLKQLDPETQEDLCFMVSAYRPGPMKYIPDYIQRKHGRQETEYLIPEMEPILKKTYGFAIYQEQVIKIAVDIAGYTMGQADLLRRAMGKKKHEIMKEEEPKFKKGVTDKGYSQDIADKIWEYLLPFADYGFNKAHGAGYAVIAYWCAYLKAHYPIEFIAGLLHSDLHDTDRIVVDINESKRMGIDVLPPDINKSELHFAIEEGEHIRFGLGAVKNTSEKAIEAIVAERSENGAFENLDDLVARVKTKNLNKKTLECLIKVGAMDSWGNRNQLLEVMPLIWDKTSKRESALSNGQSDIFGMLTTSENQSHEITPLPLIMEESKIQKTQWEKELIGTYVSEHPLSGHGQLFTSGELTTINKAKGMPEGSEIKILSIINTIRVINTKKDGKQMAFIQIEDFDDNAEGVVFSSVYRKQVEMIEELKPIVIRGKVNFRDDKFTLLADEFIDPSTIAISNKITIDIRDEQDKQNLEQLKSVISKNPGETTLEIIYGSIINKKIFTKKINPTEEVVSVISKYK